jgi:hypothetical protein
MPANYVLLERIELNASAASVTFSNIPQSGYTDLKVVCSARTSNTNGYTGGMSLRFNGSSTAVYSHRELVAATSTPSSGSGSSLSYMRLADAVGSSLTASTFGNQEIYIPNYTGSANKSVSVDGVAENNASTDYTWQEKLLAGLWGNTAAITSVTLYGGDAGTLDFLANSTFSLYGLAALGTTPVIAPKASGGNIDNDGTYWYHTFLTTGAFVPQQGLSCDVLVVAGGGGAGNGSAGSGGGGGGGGLLAFTSQSLNTTSYTVTVGAGGAGAGTAAASSGSNGVSSQFGALTAAAGGGGGGSSAVSGGEPKSGGSGGGAYFDGNGTATGGAASPSGQGNAGGNSSPSGTGGAGGGGGAGAVGSNGTSSVGGNGGAGSSAYSSWASATSTGVSGAYAGGGGGGVYPPNTTAGTGTGGGGNGCKSDLSTNTAGTTNTGGGAGGGGNGNRPAGGSGIVIIRYPIA